MSFWEAGSVSVFKQDIVRPREGKGEKGTGCFSEDGMPRFVAGAIQELYRPEGRTFVDAGKVHYNRWRNGEGQDTHEGAIAIWNSGLADEALQGPWIGINCWATRKAN